MEKPVQVLLPPQGDVRQNVATAIKPDAHEINGINHLVSNHTGAAQNSIAFKSRIARASATILRRTEVSAVRIRTTGLQDAAVDICLIECVDMCAQEPIELRHTHTRGDTIAGISRCTGADCSNGRCTAVSADGVAVAGLASTCIKV